MIEHIRQMIREVLLEIASLPNSKNTLNLPLSELQVMGHPSQSNPANSGHSTSVSNVMSLRDAIAGDSEPLDPFDLSINEQSDDE